LIPISLAYLLISLISTILPYPSVYQTSAWYISLFHYMQMLLWG
jgi:hypothetical protein